MALRTGKRCNFHSDPERHRALAAAGGRRRAIVRADDLKHFPPATTAAQLVTIVSQTLTDCRDQRLDAKVANAVAGLAATLLKLFEATSIEERLTRLETIAEERKHGRPN